MNVDREKPSSVFHSVFDKVESLGSKKVIDFQTHQGFSFVDTFEAFGVKCAEICSTDGSIKSIVSEGIVVTQDKRGNICFSLGGEEILNKLFERMHLQAIF